MEKTKTFKELFDATLQLLTSSREAQIIALFYAFLGFGLALLFYAYKSQKLKDIFLRSFLDPRGAADFKAITVFILMLVFVASIPVGIISGKWIPDSVLDLMFYSIWIGFGADAAQNIQMMRTEKKTPDAISSVTAETIESLNINEQKP